MSEEYVCQLVEAISIAQEVGTSLQDFLMDAAIEWCDCIEGRKLEELIQKGCSPMQAANTVMEKRKNEHQTATL